MRRALAVLFMCLALSSCGATPELTVLRVAAANESMYPYLYWDGGECAGIEADIARGLAGALGVPAEFIPYVREDIPAALEAGAADVGFACFPRGGRVGELLETAGYYVKRPYVLTRRGEYYPGEAALANRTVLSDGNYNYSPATKADMETCAARLLDKTADAVICDEFAAISAVKASGEALEARLYQSSAEAVLTALVPEHSAGLFAELDFEMERLIGSGEIAEIAAAYIS